MFMTDMTAPLSVRGSTPPHADVRPKLHHPVNPLAVIVFLGVIAATMLYVAYSLYVDVAETGTVIKTYLPSLLSG